MSFEDFYLICQNRLTTATDFRDPKHDFPYGMMNLKAFDFKSSGKCLAPTWQTKARAIARFHVEFVPSGGTSLHAKPFSKEILYSLIVGFRQERKRTKEYIAEWERNELCPVGFDHKGRFGVCRNPSQWVVTMPAKYRVEQRRFSRHYSHPSKQDTLRNSNPSGVRVDQIAWLSLILPLPRFILLSPPPSARAKKGSAPLEPLPGSARTLHWSAKLKRGSNRCDVSMVTGAKWGAKYRLPHPPRDVPKHLRGCCSRRGSERAPKRGWCRISHHFKRFFFSRPLKKENWLCLHFFPCIFFQSRRVPKFSGEVFWVLFIVCFRGTGWTCVHQRVITTHPHANWLARRWCHVSGECSIVSIQVRCFASL